MGRATETNALKSETLVQLVRGDVVETWHRGTLAIVDRDGTPMQITGDPRRRVFLRSAIKPLVAALVVHSGAADAFEFAPTELAIIAGSHSGTDEDAALVEGILRRIGRSESDLRNGTGGPADEPTKTRLQCAGEEPGPVRQMCSGEHAGILSLAVHSGWSTNDYWRREHPAQQAIETYLRRIFSDDDRLEVGTDDCAVPTWRVFLSTLARSYAWLACPQALPRHLSDLSEPFARVRDAMRQNPVRISGQGQLDTDLNAADGAFVAKEGAEGTLAIGCVGPGFGVALTVDDGDKTRRAAKVIALTALAGLGVLDEDTERQLRESQWPSQMDPLGRSVGEFRPAFRVNPVHRGRTTKEFSVGNRDARA